MDCGSQDRETKLCPRLTDPDNDNSADHKGGSLEVTSGAIPPHGLTFLKGYN